MSQTPRSTTPSGAKAYEVPRLKLGTHGTSMFKGPERFSKSLKKIDVESRPAKGIAELSSEAAKKPQAGGWSKNQTPRFGPDHHQPQGGTSDPYGSPVKRVKPTATDLYTPPGLGDTPKTPGRGSAAFSQTTPRMMMSSTHLSPSRSNGKVNESSTSMASTDFASPPSFVDEILSSKKGSTLFAGKPASRFGLPKRSATEGVTDVYSGGGIADRVAASRTNPLRSTTPRFIQAPKSRPRSVSPGNPTGATEGDVVDVDLAQYSMAAKAEKLKKSGGCWSKQTSDRYNTSKAAAAAAKGPQTIYTPPEFGAGVKGPKFKPGSRFQDPNSKNRIQSTAEAGQYNLPSFVDLILQK